MKNEIFNYKRFSRYFVSDIRNCMSNFWLSLILISMMGIIIYAGTIVMELIFNGEWAGPEIGFRFFVFAVSMFVLFTSMPVKCYGNLTDKREGSAWLMIPVSTFEKFLSMVLITCVAFPLIAAGVYILIDMVICHLDPTCGQNIAAAGKQVALMMIDDSVNADISLNEYPAIQHFVRQVSSPWLYVDDVLMVSLTFLFGAVFFKNGKTAKTILAVIAFSMIFSAAVMPFMSEIMKGLIIKAELNESPQNLNALFSFGIFKHAALVDTINDTLTNLALLTAIFFRIKTLKH